MKIQEIFDQRHGGPYDRGSADSYYRRGFDPHFYVGPTYMSERVEQEQMTEKEIEAYSAGYFENEELGSYKEW